MYCFPFERKRNPPVTPYSSMLEDAPEDRPRDIEELLTLNSRELDAKEMARVREWHIDHATLSPTKEFFADLDKQLAELGPMPNGKVLDFAGEIDGGGYKNSMDSDFIAKPPLELVPMALTHGCARALGHGAGKYAPNNWRRGMRWGEVFGALKRHLDKWNEEKAPDAESGLDHLDHAAACLAFLMHMVAHEAYSKMDDRP